MWLSSLILLFGILSLSVQLSVALPQGCSCNGNISDRGGGECKTEHEGEPFCYVNSGQCPDEQESSQSGWFWSKQACAPTQRAVHNQILITCTCNGKINEKGSGECKTTHEEKPFCYVNQGQCPDEQESSQSGWFWSKQACVPASTCTCNGNISEKGSGECKTEHEGQLFCYVDQGKCLDEQESSQSGWFWSKQACALGTRSSLTRISSFRNICKFRYTSSFRDIFDSPFWGGRGCVQIQGGGGGSSSNPTPTPTPAPDPDPDVKYYEFNADDYISCTSFSDCPPKSACKVFDDLPSAACFPCLRLNTETGECHDKISDGKKLKQNSASTGQGQLPTPQNGRCPRKYCPRVRVNKCCRLFWHPYRFWGCPYYC